MSQIFLKKGVFVSFEKFVPFVLIYAHPGDIFLRDICA